MLTPPDKPVNFLRPQSVQADLSLLKWGQPRWRKELLDKYGVDYTKTPAEDFATGIVTYKNPETGQLAKAQFTVSWMYDKQGLRLLCDGLGAGYGFEFNSLISSLQVFIGDVAAITLADTEAALEKQQASRGLLTIQPNEADLYGYTDENADLLAALTQGRPAMLDWEYGLEITRLNMAAYLSAERRQTVDLTDPRILAELETYVPLIQQGRGKEMLG
jgi:predicted dehydrogenase